jgi:deoxyribonuclease-4
MGGELNSREAFGALLDRLENELGKERASRFHAHFSKIEYTKGGEKRHLTFEDAVYGPEPAPLMALIRERGLTPTFICESDGTQAEDACVLMQLYGGDTK